MFIFLPRVGNLLKLLSFFLSLRHVFHFPHHFLRCYFMSFSHTSMGVSTLSGISKNSLAHMGSQYFDVWVTSVSPQFLFSLLILLVEILVVWFCAMEV